MTDTKAAKTTKCPACGEPAEIYDGENALKQGTVFCAKEGRRYPKS